MPHKESTTGSPSEFAAQLSIIIVGAGLSGLAAAIQSALGGHSVLVLESTKELTEIGAGLQVTPNASNLLQQWGLSESFWASVAKPKKLNIRRYSDGKIIYTEQDFGPHMQQEYHAPFANIHRVDLQKAMFKRAEELGVKFRFGQRIAEADINNACVTSTTGEKFEADLIIGADGLWSRCRETLLGKQDKPIPTGDIVYRIILKADEIPDQDLRDRVTNPEINFWFGPDRHVLSYSVRAGTMLNIVAMVPDDLPPELSKADASREELEALFSSWDPTLNRYLNLVKKVEKWRLMHRPEVETWINEKRNFALIGDACHPMIPYLAQGANSSIEDGAVIGLLLSKMSLRSHLPRAIQMYEKMRKARGEAIARESLLQRDVYQMHDGPEQEERDATFREAMGREIVKGDRFPFRWTCPIVQPWLFGYDAKYEVEKAFLANPFH